MTLVSQQEMNMAPAQMAFEIIRKEYFLHKEENKNFQNKSGQQFNEFNEIVKYKISIINHTRLKGHMRNRQHNEQINERTSKPSRLAIKQGFFIETLLL